MKVWDIEDQLTFARISGDYNPVHMDPLFARKSIFGKAVVHGIHQLLWALNELLSDSNEKIKLKKLNVSFRKNVGLGEAVSLSIKKREGCLVKAYIKKGDLLMTDIHLEWHQEEFTTTDSLCCHRSFKEEKPKEPKIKDLSLASGRLDISTDISLVQQIFPVLYKVLPWQQIACLLATTRLVGMECPGMRSIYHELDLQFTGNTQDDPVLSYKVNDFNEVVNLLEMRLESDIAFGYIKAFVRPVLNREFKADELTKHIVPGEFKDQQALVVGGSRGLGAVTAKLLALGGAQVCATYFKGEKEILDMENDLKSHGVWFKTKVLDVRDEKLNIADCLGDDFKTTHLYYFATPLIAGGSKKDFSKDLFEHFSQYYLMGFWRLFEQLQARHSLQFVLYPSSIFVEQMPADMFEYAVAKTAGEAMCNYIQKNFSEVMVSCPRLERLATEQTLSILPVENKDPVPVILDLLRAAKLK